MSVLTSILSFLLAFSPVDTTDCGTYPAEEVEEVVVSIVEPLLLGDVHRGRSILGLVVQPDAAEGFRETDQSVCASLVRYFADNIGSLYIRDASYLLANGWTCAVVRFGEYWILLIAPRSTEGMVGSPLASLLFFDTQGRFVKGWERNYRSGRWMA